MHYPVKIFACVIVCGVAIKVGAQPSPPGASITVNQAPPPPPSAHWYQYVAKGVTVTNLTPIAYFRGLLGMNEAERQRVLADQPPKEREQIMAKIREYQDLPREVREERLRRTELHWYMLALLRLSPEQRQQKLKEISPLYQPMIINQLHLWDSLPADTRKALVDNEVFLRTYLQLQDVSGGAQEERVKQMSSAQRERWTRELNRWQALPDDKRRELTGAFRQFFYSTGEQRKETIQSLSPDERKQMESALSSYSTLPPETQRLCVDSFSKFASMSGEERNQFLHNAAKWEAMSSYERDVWRQLVNRLPPVPPNFFRSKLPPMPPNWPGTAALPTALGGGNGVTNVASLSVPPR